MKIAQTSSPLVIYWIKDKAIAGPQGPVAQSSVKSAWFKSDLEVYQT